MDDPPKSNEKSLLFRTTRPKPKILEIIRVPNVRSFAKSNTNFSNSQTVSSSL